MNYTYGDLKYEPETGLFYWTRGGCGRQRDRPAGCRAGRYVSLKVDGKTVLAHRLAWFIMTGVWPEEIDHENGDGLDNRWSNLREVSRSENMYNRSGWGKLPKYIYRSGKGFRVQRQVDGKLMNFGTYETLEQALEVRNKVITKMKELGMTL